MSDRKIKGSLLKIVLIVLLIILLGGAVFYKHDKYKRYIELQPTVGNMNGIELTIPASFRGYSPEYKGESVWRPLPDPPERTHKSKLDSFHLVVIRPYMENHKQKENMAARHANKKINDSAKEKISIEVQTLFENKPSESVKGIIADSKAHGVYLYPFFDALKLGYTRQKQDDYEKKFDELLKLNVITPIGPHAHEVYSGNTIYYWDGDVRIYPNDDPLDYLPHNIKGKVNTIIECPNSNIKVSHYDRCTQYYEIPELGARVTLNYDRQMLPYWRDMQQKSQSLILSFKHSAH